MFDLIFFILMVVTLVKASKGNYNETLANFSRFSCNSSDKSEKPRP